MKNSRLNGARLSEARLCIKLYNSLRIRFVRASPYRQTRDTS